MGRTHFICVRSPVQVKRVILILVTAPLLNPDQQLEMSPELLGELYLLACSYVTWVHNSIERPNCSVGCGRHIHVQVSKQQHYPIQDHPR